MTLQQTAKDYLRGSPLSETHQPNPKDGEQLFGDIDTKFTAVDTRFTETDSSLALKATKDELAAASLAGATVTNINNSITGGNSVPVPRLNPDDIGIQSYAASQVGRVIGKTDWKGREYLGVVVNDPIASEKGSALSAIRPGTYSANVDTGIIDLGGLGCARLKIKVGRQGVTFSGTDSIVFKLETSADGITFADAALADFDGQDAPVSVTSGSFLRLETAHAVAKDYVLTYIGGARYIRVSAVFAGTHSTGTKLGLFVTRGVLGGGLVDSTQVSPAINLRGSSVATIAFFLGKGGIVFDASNKIGFRLEHSDDGSTWVDVDVDDVSGADAPTSVTSGIVMEWASEHFRSAANSIFYHGGKSRVRMSWVFTGTHSEPTFCDATLVSERVEPLRNSQNQIIFDPLKRDPLLDPQIPRVLATESAVSGTGKKFTRVVLDRADYDVTGTFSVSEDGLISPDRHNRLYVGYGQSNDAGSGDLNLLLTTASYPDHIAMPSMASGINNVACGIDRIGIPLPSNLGSSDIQRFIPAVDKEAGPGGQLSNLHGQKPITALAAAITEDEVAAFGEPRSVKIVGSFGVGGATIATLLPSDGSTFKAYDDIPTFVQSAVTIKAVDSENCVVEMIPFKQGEADSNTAFQDYLDRFKEMKEAVTIDTMAITGQIHEPPILMSQNSYYTSSNAGNANAAMLQMAHAGNVVLWGPDYPMTFMHSESLYHDIVHFKGKGTIKYAGAWLRRAARAARFGDHRPRWMEPLKATVSSTTITVKFGMAETGIEGQIQTGVTDLAGTLNGVTVTQTGGTARSLVSMAWDNDAVETAVGLNTLVIQISGTLDGTAPKLNFGIEKFETIYDEVDRPITRLSDTSSFTNPLDALLGFGSRTYENYCVPTSISVD